MDSPTTPTLSIISRAQSLSRGGPTRAEMAEQKAATAVDPMKALGIQILGDGKVLRSSRVPDVPPDELGASEDGVLSKDITLEPGTPLWARVFLPRHRETPDRRSRFPVILYFHGGGFVLYNPNHGYFHTSCTRMAKICRAIVVSVAYRLAPESRLPAAYEDASAALRWLRSQATGAQQPVDPWLESGADFSRCFLAGGSSGANIVYRLALSIGGADLRPLRVAGAVMIQPFFGGNDRTESELRLAADRILPLPVTDLVWSLALPEGADRDHEFSNPAKRRSPNVGSLPRCMVAVEGLDPLYDRQMEFVRMLREAGVQVVVRCDEEGFHGVQIFDVRKAEALYNDIANFLSSVE